MRVCIINEFFYPDSTGGTGAVLSDLARHLNDYCADVKIDVITSRKLYRGDAKGLAAREDWEGITIHRLSTPAPNRGSTKSRLVANTLFTIAALFKLFSMRKYDVLLLGTAPPMVPIAGQVYRLLRGTPFIYVIYDLEPDIAVAVDVLSADSRTAKALKYCQQKWLKSAFRIVVIGRCMQDHLVHSYGQPRNKIKVIPIGFAPDEVYPMSRATRFRRKHDIAGFVVLYAGNFGRHHNFDAILDAAKQLKEKGQKVSFVLVGNGAQRGHIEERIARETINNVRLLPFVPKEDFSDLMASADVSLITLEPGMEGLCVPSKLYSILASGRPAIAMVGPESEIAYVLAEAECGVQIDQGNTAKLVEVLAKWSKCPEELERMGHNARRVLMEKYTTEHAANHYYFALKAATGGFEETVVTAVAEPATVSDLTKR